MKAQFRATAPQDSPAVAALLERIFSSAPGLPLTAPAHLHWKNWEPLSGWPGSRGYAMSREDAIVAHGTVVPLECAAGGRRLKMAHLIDWAADAGSVGSGVILLKQIARMVEGVLAVGGSDDTQRVMPALGFRVCGGVTRFARPVRPLKRIAGQKPGTRMAAQFARSVLWSLQAPSGRTSGWSASRVAPTEIASLPLPKPAAGMALFARTPETLRYLLRCPAAPMELHAVSKGGAARGYFLLARVPGQTRIADFYVDSSDRDDWRALVQLAVAEGRRHPDAAEVAALGSDSLTRQALLDSGFHARGDLALRVLTGKGVELPAGEIRFQMIDNDFAYLHDGHRTYWA